MTVRNTGSARRARKIPTVSIRYEDTSAREVPVRQLRLADFAESKPRRDVRSVHGMTHYSGKYSSVTTGGHVVYGHVVYEGRLEPARLLLADFDPAAQGIFAQPCRLAARVGDRVRAASCSGLSAGHALGTVRWSTSSQWTG
ncbi:hypothetical protein [Streptomyces sp. NPDC093097]|uniref:hypothetical protein n=1 Tax=Streptomyces sp. NPDC093097 TaxID=3366027 RepID=UPI0037F21029